MKFRLVRMRFRIHRYVVLKQLHHIILAVANLEFQQWDIHGLDKIKGCRKSSLQKSKVFPVKAPLLTKWQKII
jgi:hypothetical protein